MRFSTSRTTQDSADVCSDQENLRSLDQNLILLNQRGLSEDRLQFVEEAIARFNRVRVNDDDRVVVPNGHRAFGQVFPEKWRPRTRGRCQASTKAIVEQCEEMAQMLICEHSLSLGR